MLHNIEHNDIHIMYTFHYDYAYHNRQWGTGKTDDMNGYNIMVFVDIVQV